MLYELRLYAVQLGRSADIEQRMLEEVPPLFAEHRMKSIGHWRVLAGPDLPGFIYMLAWDGPAEREAGWARFYADERWWRMRARTNAGSELVERYGLWLMQAFAATEPLTLTCGPHEVHEMAIHHVPISRRDAITAHLSDCFLPAISRAGGKVWGCFEVIAGPRVPCVVLIISWPDYAARNEWNARAANAEGAELLGRSDVQLLQPLPASRTGIEMKQKGEK